MASSKFPIKLFLRENSPRIIFSFIVSLFHVCESVNQHVLIASPPLPYQLFDDSNPSHSALQVKLTYIWRFLSCYASLKYQRPQISVYYGGK